jgi:transmembrane sensor
MRDRHPSPEELPVGALARYVAGESDRSERARVEAWAAASVERRAYVAVLLRSWARNRAGATSAELRETDAAWAALRARLGEVPAAPMAGASSLDGDVAPDRAPRRSAARLPDLRRGTKDRLVLRGAAAAILIAAGAGGALHFVRPLASPPTVALEQAPMREVVTGIGERARIRLGDGSTIVLAARSRLGIPAGFGIHTRELEAEGEAYFEVAHDSTRPFIVHARGARALDIGTAFVLRAYPDDPAVSIVVTDGSVTFGADSQLTPRAVSTTLRRGEMGRLAAGGRVPVVSAVNPESYTGWMYGRLSFDNAPLPEVISELGRWHHAEISLADSSLARETVTATLTADSFGDALQTLTTVLSLRAERTGTKVVLHRVGKRR